MRYLLIGGIFLSAGCAAFWPETEGGEAMLRQPSINRRGPSFTQQGLASYYARKFHGRKTANGEQFNTHELTAAHRTLAFGTMVQVTNLENGKTIEVRINDRGPYRGGRIIDLSEKAAHQIGIMKDGTAKVKLEVMG